VNTCDKHFFLKYIFILYFPQSCGFNSFKKIARLLKFIVFKNSKKFVVKWQNVQKERKNVDQYVAYHYG